ncbi:MAG TPA: hypothetical protein VFF68_09975 [Anaerolineaceae bacterium]|nr:hypothetical protein [Anaerolineaceae bacterium]
MKFPPKTLRNLPQSPEIWYCVIRQLKVWVNSPERRPFRPYALLVLNLDSGLMIEGEAFETAPEPADVFDSLADLMMGHPEAPSRPQAVLFEESRWMARMLSGLERIEIETGLHDDPTGTDTMVSELETHLRGGRAELPALLDQPGASVQTVGAFFSAAAACYTAAPWQELSDADLLRVWVGPQAQPALVSVLGNAGIQYGLSVYWSIEQMQRVYAQTGDEHDSLPAEGLHALFYEGMNAVAFADLEAMEAYGWPVAGETAYPMPVILYPGGGIDRPGAEQLQWYESLLLALPEIVRHHLHADSLGELAPLDTEITVNTSGGFCLVRVQYPAVGVG